MNRSIALWVAVSILLTACHANTGGALPAVAVANDRSSAACAVRRYSLPVAPAYAKTIWPSEKHDEWRTAAVAGGLPASLKHLMAKSVALPPVPVWGYVGLDGDLYVLGGQPYLLDIYTKLMLGKHESEKKLLAESLAYSERVKPYVAKVNPDTMATTILYLPGKHGVNYIGGMLVHANGYLYAVARAVLYKIDPNTFSIVASKNLPLLPGSSGKPDVLTAYNGMQATATGDLVLKGFAASGVSGVLVRVDPVDLSIRAKLESTALAGARLAIATNGGRQYVYTAGSTDSIRFLIGKTDFTLDDSFSQQYLTAGSGSTEGTSEVYMGDGVVFTNNTTPSATTPMTIFAQAATDGSQLQSQPAFTGSDKAWNWEMPSGDPFGDGILAAQDQLSGYVSGFRACGGGASVKKLWENDRIDDSIGLAIDTMNHQLYADDHRCTAARICTLAFVVLDIRTGRELRRIKVAGDEPSIGQIFVGPHNTVFHLSTDTDRPEGYITRITAN
jgi:hypothetical protein